MLFAWTNIIIMPSPKPIIMTRQDEIFWLVGTNGSQEFFTWVVIVMHGCLGNCQPLHCTSYSEVLHKIFRSLLAWAILKTNIQKWYKSQISANRKKLLYTISPVKQLPQYTIAEHGAMPEEGIISGMCLELWYTEITTEANWYSLFPVWFGSNSFRKRIQG